MWEGELLIAEYREGYDAKIYLYDGQGSPAGFLYKDDDGYYTQGIYMPFYYEKNLQGDIVGLIDHNGNRFASYTYDAWGNLLDIEYSGSGLWSLHYTVAEQNPFRYRGYYWDSETGFYYLVSRYYDPATGRFLNADGQLNDGLLGSNLYAYCENNPVMYTDPDGSMPRWLRIAAGVAAATLAIAVTVATMGSAAPAAICVASSMLSGVLGSTAATVVATVGAYAVIGATALYAADGMYSMVTGESFLLNDVFNGNEKAYQAGAVLTTVAAAGFMYLASLGEQAGTCFVAGTLVETENGSVPIEAVTAGMLVYAHDPETGKTELKEVVRTFVRETNELVHIKVSGEEIITTPTHPFWVPEKGWTDAIQLRAGDRLQLLNGEYVIVEQVQHELLENPVTVYNFEVEDFHTYYVSDSAILVHNKCGNNGRYEKAPYHNKGSSIKSAAPINGQAALNNSIQVSPNSPRRVGISNGQFVVLDQTSPGVFHGHVRIWADLEQIMKNALINSGMVNRHGKIL